MKRSQSGHSIHSLAPALLGAICLLLASTLGSCDSKQPETSAPDQQAGTAATAVAPDPAPAPPAETTESPPAEPQAPAADSDPLPATLSRRGGQPRAEEPVAAAVEPETETALRFVSFNLKNWLTMERYSKGKKLPGRPKPEEEKAAAVATIAAAKPDVLGICEIGTMDDLKNLQSMLADAGCDLPHLHHTGGEDDTRRLGLLSRLPIVNTAEPADSDYELSGQTFHIQRGILDVTVETGDRRYRFLGVHFKSKREIEEADQAEMRRNEAHLMRSHIDSILKADPEVRLIAYGDMNDTRREPPVRAVQGTYNTPSYLTAVRVADSRGHVWTHHWEYQDVYSRFDYVLVNKLAKADVDFDSSRILDPENWDEASDHRALLVVFE